MKENLRCVLCDSIIFPEHTARKYAEGPFCGDTAGCRRRALLKIDRLSASLGLLKRWAEGDTKIGYQDAVNALKRVGIEVTA